MTFYRNSLLPPLLKIAFLWVSLVLGAVFQVAGQEEACGTIFTADQEESARAFREALQRQRPDVRQQNALSRLPIQLYVVRNDNGSGGPSEGDMNNALSSVNGLFASINLEFFYCAGINFIDRSDFYEFSTNEENALMSLAYAPGKLNLYVVNNIEQSGDGAALCGYTYLPWDGKDVMILDQSCVLGSGNTFAHELGHYLGLFHTHGRLNGTLTDEWVNGNNCLVAGDEICDTPADPQLSSTKVNPSCTYIGGEVDGNGDPFTPDPSNIMSYAPGVCRTAFTGEQYTRMLGAYQQYHQGRLTCQTGPRCEADSVELVSFYNTHGGNGWNNTWNFSNPVDTWFGVQVNESGCVTQLNLAGNNVAGTLPDFQLPELELLNLNDNQLTGGLPNFSGMPKLTYLAISNNGLTGSIPNFSSLPQLTYLVLETNALGGNLPDLSGTPLLTDLGLGNNQLTGPLPDFNLPQLEVLSVWKNQLSGNLPNFSHLNQLRNLQLGNNQLSGTIPDFSNLGVLETLSLWVNQFSGDLPDFSALPQLRSLDVSNNLLTGVPDFSQLSQLEQLTVNGNRLTLEDLVPNAALNLPAYNYSPQATYTPTQDSYVAEAGESITLSWGVDGGVVGATFSWRKDDQAFLETAVPSISFDPVKTNDAGTYTCIASHPELNGFSLAMAPISLQVNAPACNLNLSIAAAPATCGNNNGRIQLSTVNGLAPYTYQWAHGPTGPVLDGLASGTYQVTVTDELGCEVIRSIEVEGQPSPQVSLAEKSDASCNLANGQATLEISGGVSPLEIAWSHGPTGVSSLTDLPSGAYEVVITDANGCESTLNFEIKEAAGPTLSLEATADAHCGQADGTATLSIAGGAEPYTILWSHGPQNQSSLTDLSAGTYQVSLVDAKGCERQLEIEIDDLPGPSVSLTNTEDAHCGQADGSARISIQGGQAPFDIVWSHGPVGVEEVSGLAAGNYSATVTDAHGCTSEVAFTLSDQDGPTIDALSTEPATCGEANGAATLRVSGGQAPYEIEWAHGPKGISELKDMAPGTYQVQITDALGCKIEEQVMIEDQPGPTLSLQSKTDAACGQANGTAQVAVAGGKGPYNVQWAHGPTSLSLQNLAAGSYTLTVEDDNDCISNLTVNIGSEDGPEINLVTVDDATCGQDNGRIQIEVAGGTGALDIVWAHGAQGTDLQGLRPGTYAVEVKDANDCLATFQATVDSVPQPHISEVLLTPAYCGQDNGTATLQLSGGSAPFEINWSDGQEGEVAFDLAPGIYQVTVLDQAGCEELSEFEIETHEKFSTDLEETRDAYCGSPGGAIRLLVEGAVNPLSIRWDNGMEGPHIFGLTPGAYTAYLRDGVGCKDTLTAQVKDLNDPARAAFEAVIQLNEVAFTNLSQHADSFFWDFDDEFFSYLPNPIHRFEKAGTYTVMLIASNGCNADTSFQTLSIEGTTSQDPNLAGPGITLDIFPNPGDQFLHAQLTGMKDREVDYSLLDLQGKILESHPVPNSPGQKITWEIPLGHLGVGMYFLRVKVDGQALVSKLVITR